MEFLTEAKALDRLAYRREASEAEKEAARLVEERGKALRFLGWRILPWTPQTVDGPWPWLSQRERWSMFPIGEDYSGWMDHIYRLVRGHARYGQTIFVSEPYWECETTRRTLVPEEFAPVRERLSMAGWRVSIRPEWALHYPNRTTAIWISRGAWGPCPKYACCPTSLGSPKTREG